MDFRRSDLISPPSGGGGQSLHGSNDPSPADGPSSSSFIPTTTTTGGPPPLSNPTAAAPTVKGCGCGLDPRRVFHTLSVDYPRPAPPLSKCELHEIVKALPPRLQNYPWRLRYDTAQDGSSLRNFYRAMEPVYSEGASGIGILFVRDRDTDSTSINSGGGVGRTGIIGCFAPQVPCLEGHGGGQHSFYGSPDTFVFRISQAGKRVGYKGPPELVDETRTASATAVTGALPQPSRSLESSHPASLHASFGSALLNSGGGHRSGSTCASQPVSAGYHSIFIDHTASTQILPMPTHSHRAAMGGDLPAHHPLRSVVAAASTEAPNAPQERFLASPTYRKSVSSPFGTQGEFGAPPGASASSMLPLPPPPLLLTRYRWTGNPTNRKFVLAANGCFAIGGGKDGAALYVDDTLQLCTSSLHCQTFDSPALFGRDPVAGLRQTEMRIDRMVWFSVRDGPSGDFRVMADPIDDGDDGDGDKGTGALPDSMRCGCGRQCPATNAALTRSDELQPPVQPVHTCYNGFFVF